ncbi:hypothetical protein [Helicobacter canis]|uniref:Uncharacterized protein n=1 Tax=Helicobacter canis TaxID=29419 RepID=A0A377J1K4_9HELI|nr:hypothetical protein [Helicobacter canis]STO96357.1 Uncharacterised protein [Helicobacter canis]
MNEMDNFNMTFSTLGKGSSVFFSVNGGFVILSVNGNKVLADLYSNDGDEACEKFEFDSLEEAKYFVLKMRQENSDRE